MTFEEAREQLNELFIDIQVPGYSIGDFDPEFIGSVEDLEEIFDRLQETYAPKIKMTSKQKDELMQLIIQVEISKAYFKNILEVDPNISIGSPSHLENCVRVMKTSAEKALEALEDTDD